MWYGKEIMQDWKWQPSTSDTIAPIAGGIEGKMVFACTNLTLLIGSL